MSALFRVIGSVFLFSVFCGIAAGQNNDRETAARWIAEHFPKPAGADGNSVNAGSVIAPQTGLYVVANNDRVQTASRHGQPMNLSGMKKTAGLYCHAFSRIIVFPGKPVERVQALIGVDSNSQTSGGRGSVVFTLKRVDGDAPTADILLGKTKETEVFRSEKLTEGKKPVAVDVKLDGAKMFILEVDDGGDGIACDQADWADLTMTLTGSEQPVAAETLPFRCLIGKSGETELPFSFKYNAVPSAKLLPKWKLERKEQKLDADRIQHLLTWTDPETLLSVQCRVIEYLDFPSVEWVLHFKNNGTKNTPIISEIRSIDINTNAESGIVNHPWQNNNQGAHAETPGAGSSTYILHHAPGSSYRPDEFAPLQTVLKQGKSEALATSGGRPTRAAMPYFNIENENGGGLIAVIGWSGQWAAQFKNNGNGLQITGGQELTHFTVYPGEEVRTPLTVLQFWSGKNWIAAQNVWRQWMLKYGTPQQNGQVIQPHFAGCSSHQYGEMVNATDKTQIAMIDRYLAEGIKLDYWWMDAGWYVIKNTNSWTETGTWEVDTKRFPKGLRAVSDYAHRKGVKTIVWFEPERVHKGTFLAEQHPDWVLGGKNGGLLNLGNPDAWKWLVEHIDSLITSQDIDFYRQDFNMDPLGYWRENDAPDRQGMTEIKHVTGYLAYWDELLRRHPNLWIDTCASGGNRLDLETLRRSVSLLRSDYILRPVSNQGQTYGLSFWIPLFGTGLLQQSGGSAIYGGETGLPEPYQSRSVLMPFENSCSDVRTPAGNGTTGSADYPNIRRFYKEWQQVSPYFYGNYYPLTPYSLDEEAWIAWQFDLPKQNKGAVQVFRRKDSPYEAAKFPLFGLEPAAKYKVEDIDKGVLGTFTGKELMDAGLRISLERKPDAGVMFYEKVE